MMADKTLPALKIEIEGDVTSFRYALFSHGFQPTYDMPPPSTIYGHICSALGRYMTDEELSAIRFGYRFVHSGKFVDYMEHLHFEDPIQPLPMNRQLLFRPRLTLYLTGLDLYEAFINPRYMVVLGRSQDLVSYRTPEPIILVQAESAYFEHTLLPLWMAPRLERNVTVATMARYVDARRRPQWGGYALLHGTAEWPPPETKADQESSLQFEENLRTELWVDPTVKNPKNPNLARAVWLHSFVGSEDERLSPLA